MKHDKQSAGRLGGLATVRKHGREYMAAIGKRGAASFWSRYTLFPSGAAGWAIVDRQTGNVRAYNPNPRIGG